METDDEEDSHFCLRCKTVIRGLENYIEHRKQKCNAQVTSVSCVDTVASDVSDSNHVTTVKCHDTITGATTGPGAHTDRDNVKETVEQSVVTGHQSNIVSSDDQQASSFFESLQLHSTSKHHPVSGEDGLQSERQPHESGDVGRAERLEDMSFFESIGLYWVNPADKNDGVESDQVTQEPVEVGQAVVEQVETKDNVDNEFDFLQMLGLAPSSSQSGVNANKKWRLWNPDIDPAWEEDILYRDLELPDPDPSSTDPTIVEHSTLSSPQGINRRRNVSQKNDVMDVVELNINSRPKRDIKRPQLFEIAVSEAPAKKVRLEVREDKQQQVTTVARESKLMTCPSCEARVLPRQLGKHLVSHYHYHRSLGHADNETLILDNIQDIVHQSPYQCHLCQFYCNYHDQLVSHVRNHPPEIQQSTFWCQVCMKIIPDHHHLVSHLKTYGHTELVNVINRSVPVIIKNISLVSCSLCDKQFRFNLSLKKHMRVVHGDVTFELENHEKFQCSLCNYFSYRRSSLKMHNFLVHPNPKLKYDCYICKQQFVSKETSIAHRNSATHKLNSELHKANEENLICSFCSENFLDEEDLRKHLESLHSKELSQCHLCGGLFHFPQELTLHLKLQCQTSPSVTGDVSADHRCTQCSLGCVSDSVMTLHMASVHHSGVTPPTGHSGGHHQCPLCQVTVASGQLAEHVQYHAGDLLHCQHCHSLFTSENKFRKHSQSCNVEFNCDQCSYKTKKKILLNLHVKRNHSNGEKKEVYECSLCHEQFSKKTSLSKHMTSHEQRVPKFHCSHCDFKGMYKSDLERHMLRHSESKDLKCLDCNFVCKRKNELARHNKLVHQDTPVNACNFCDYKTKNVDHFKRHMDRRHNVGSDMTYLEVMLDENDFILSKKVDTQPVPEFVTEQIVIDT